MQSQFVWNVSTDHSVYVHPQLGQPMLPGMLTMKLNSLKLNEMDTLLLINLPATDVKSQCLGTLTGSLT